MRNPREKPIIIVRKKINKGGHHGGAWKVAFADFMTSMMAMFLVLWIVSQSSDIKSAIAGYFADPLGRASEFGHSIVAGTGAQSASSRPLSEEQILQIRRDRLKFVGNRLRRNLHDSLDFRAVEEHVEVILVDDGLRVELIENAAGVFFQLGSASPSGHGRDLLALIGAEFASMPNPVVIEGHTDARPFGRPDYSNWELSADRANVARRIMISAGFPEEQIAQIRGHADRVLRDPTDPLSPRNRRITITMLIDYNLAPTADAEED